MKIEKLFQTARSVTVQIEDGGIFDTVTEYEIEVNGCAYGRSARVVTSLYGLKPGTGYEIRFFGGGSEGIVRFCTDEEFVTLNVKDFGAKGDGVWNDTLAIQAAIMACPPKSRVLVPAGVYRITSLFLKDHLRLELEKGAVLSAETDRNKFPVFPARIQSYDEEQEYLLGTWEGNPLPMFTGIVTGVRVRDVVLYGQGTIDGNANDNPDNWWYNAKEKKVAFRPRMVFLHHCEDVTLQGIRVQNSPSWNIHPYFSNHLKFLDLTVRNPKDSPNTDGLDPESCRDVLIAGVDFSLGDDCIALKSGKIYMGATYHTPCEDVTVRQCCMRDGHGSVTVGSEIAGGVKNLTVQDCKFLHTDRGLRIKTRRGRGRDSVIQGIVFDNIRMDHVMTPFVVNCFYYCDPDGHSEYVSTKEALPVDWRTPSIKDLTFRRIEAVNCHVAAAFFYGLPEQKIETIVMEQIRVTFAEEAAEGIPAMMDGLEPCSRMGIFAENVVDFTMEHVTVEGQEGEACLFKRIDRINQTTDR